MRQRLLCSGMDEVDTVEIAHQRSASQEFNIAFSPTANGLLSFSGNFQIALVKKGQNGLVLSVN